MMLETRRQQPVYQKRSESPEGGSTVVKARKRTMTKSWKESFAEASYDGCDPATFNYYSSESAKWEPVHEPGLLAVWT